VYCVVVLASGQTDFELLNAEQVNHRRARSKAAKSNKGPWITDEDEMWRKTAVRVLFKRIPQTAEIAEADDEERLEALAAERASVGMGVAALANRAPVPVRPASGYEIGEPVLQNILAQPSQPGEQPPPADQQQQEGQQAEQPEAAPGKAVPVEVVDMGDKRQPEPGLAKRKVAYGKNVCEHGVRLDVECVECRELYGGA
jgi:recombinational DNA repair protein RecT